MPAALTNALWPSTQLVRPMVGWVLWEVNARGNSFYALVLEPDDWEREKELNDQRYFLATGSSRTFAIAKWDHVNVSESGPTISAAVKGTNLVSVTDGPLTASTASTPWPISATSPPLGTPGSDSRPVL